jgi:hypothetical protein
MAEMTTLTATIYRVYRTRVRPGTGDTSPGITSRFEVFYDETMPRMKVRDSPNANIVADSNFAHRSMYV